MAWPLAKPYVAARRRTGAAGTVMRREKMFDIGQILICPSIS
jgi:hypothetical protein